MRSSRKKRLYFILGILLGVSAAVSLAIYALGQNVDLYFTPSQLLNQHSLPQHSFRLGGMVALGSVRRVPNSLEVSFQVTDFRKTLTVHYTGILPALFREGQGIVVEGHLGSDGAVTASQVLAKHDENYKPPSYP